MEEITPEDREFAIERLTQWGGMLASSDMARAYRIALAALRQPEPIPDSEFVETSTRPWGIKRVAPEHEVIDQRLAALEQAVLLDAQASLGGLHARIEQLEERAARASSALGVLDERIARLEKFGGDTQVKVQEIWDTRNQARDRVAALEGRVFHVEEILRSLACAAWPKPDDDDDDEIEHYDWMEE